VLPAASVARTWNVWLPFPGRYSSAGSCRLRSTRVELQAKVLPAFVDVKLKLALLLVLVAAARRDARVRRRGSTSRCSWRRRVGVAGRSVGALERVAAVGQAAIALRARAGCEALASSWQAKVLPAFVT